MSTAKDQEAILTGAYVDVTPTFNYHREYEIVKRFIEQLSRNGGKLAHDQILYVEANLNHVREAFSDILSDDIERQIKLTNDFPIRDPQLFLHEFSPNPNNPENCTKPGYALAGSCLGRKDSLVHSL